MGIRVLPVHLVNRIAAGEVIERPASVVKELVENALDAGAGRIDVTIEDGGKKLIQVTDDGSGMDSADLALTFRPHATSKLTGEEDLFRITTMGFRGEALASVASISHAQIRTCRPGEAGGHEVSAAGAEVGEVRPCASASGTTVTVRDLFFNTPARRKFLRTANTESGHVVEQITRLALPHAKVAFTLTRDGREVLNLPACQSTASRVGDLFGVDLGEAMLRIVSRGGGQVGVSGLIAPPSAARASGKWQYFFLNGRYIRDRVLAHALREAYRGLIEPNRWPVAMLFIETDPGEVDVNVHPTKIEVRFRDSQLVHGEVLAALRETLNRANLAPTADLSGPGGLGGPDVTEDPARQQRRASLREALADFFKSAPPPQPRLSFPQDAPVKSAPGASDGTGAPPKPPVGRWQPAGQAGWPDQDAPPDPGQPGRGQQMPAATCQTAVTAPAQAIQAIQAIQIHNAYIVAPDEDGLIIIDQHALHERLIYNDLRRRLAQRALTAQKMLIPQTLSVTAAEADCLQRHADLLARLGIEVAPFGPNTVAVQQFPSMLAARHVPVDEFLREVLDRLSDDETTDTERLIEDILAMLACKAAVKAGDPLTVEEIESLLSRRESAEKVSACPHGRPTTLKLTLKDLDKQFRRT